MRVFMSVGVYASVRVRVRVRVRTGASAALLRRIGTCACVCAPCIADGFAITAEQSEVECDATGSSFESSRALPLFLLKGKGVVADKASAKHIDTGGALGVVKNYFRTCRR